MESTMGKLAKTTCDGDLLADQDAGRGVLGADRRSLPVSLPGPHC